MASNKAEDWLDDLETVGQYAAEKIGSTLGQTPVVKAMSQVLANPTPQEVGAQVAGLAKSASNTLQESFGGDPVDVALNYGPGAMGTIVPKSNFLNAIKKKGITGDRFLDISDLADELEKVGAKLHEDGTVSVYHRTTPQNAEQIVKTGKMFGKEDRLFFGTKPVGQISGYGDAVVETRLPIEKLELNDVFNGEAHLTYKKPISGTLKANFIKAEDFLDQ